MGLGQPSGNLPARLPPRVVFWRGGSAWVGGVGVASAHAHHAIQVCLGLDGPLRLRDGDGAWCELAGAIVSPDRMHTLDTQGGASAVLFLAPESRQGRQVLGSMGVPGVHPAPEGWVVAHVGWLRSSLQERWADDALARRCRHALATLAGREGEAPHVDPRIMAVITWLESSQFRPVTLAEAARVAGLSGERFRHLFVAQTGIPFRSYLLWARVQAAANAGIAGASWTDAAQEAGFADSAHLSRTFRRMFGLSPSMLSMPAPWR